MLSVSRRNILRVITFTAIFILLSVTVMNPTDGVTPKADMPEVAEGDQWKYTLERRGAEKQMNVTVNITSVEEKIRDVPTDTIYDCYKAKENTPNTNSTQYFYYEKDTFNIVVWHTPEDEILFFTPSWNKFDYPIEVGEEWESHPDVYNKSGNKVKMDYNYHYVCEERVNVTVPAGNFYAYKINKTFKGILTGKTEGGQQTLYRNSTLYYSPDVKNMVKITYYDRVGRVSGQRELESYELHEIEDNGNDNDNIPGLTLTTVLITTTAVTIIEKRRREGKN